MIKFKRDDNMSIFLYFDRPGLVSLIDAITVAASGSRALLEVYFDRSVMTLKRSSPTEVTTMVITRGAETGLTVESGQLVWRIEDEDLDCLVSLFTACQSNGTIGTSELIRVKVPKNKNLDYLHGAFVATSDDTT